MGHVLAMMLIHFCRKILYGIDLQLKIGIYIASLKDFLLAGVSFDILKEIVFRLERCF